MTRFTKFFENYMKIMGPFGTLFFYIQAYKIFVSKNASEISSPAFMLAIVTYTSWLIYSILIKNNPLLLTSLSALIGSTLILVGKLTYG